MVITGTGAWERDASAARRERPAARRGHRHPHRAADPGDRVRLAVVAALVPLALGLVAIVVGAALTALLGEGFMVSVFALNIVTMMGLAVGIDYTLFIVSRFREELAAGRAVPDAVGRAAATASRAVLFSGMTVVLALSGMLVVPFTIFTSLGAGAICRGRRRGGRGADAAARRARAAGRPRERPAAAPGPAGAARPAPSADAAGLPPARRPPAASGRARPRRIMRRPVVSLAVGGRHPPAPRRARPRACSAASPASTGFPRISGRGAATRSSPRTSRRGSTLADPGRHRRRPRRPAGRGGRREAPRRGAGRRPLHGRRLRAQRRRRARAAQPRRRRGRHRRRRRQAVRDLRSDIIPAGDRRRPRPGAGRRRSRPRSPT